jgi:SpoVK/Ycf46/Vps4 family AAA+-type ATPase
MTPRIRKHFAPLSAFEMDENERFLLSRCAVYLHRHLDQTASLDGKSLEAVCWVLGEERKELGTELLAHLRGALCKELQEELSEADLEGEDYADILIRYLRRSPKRAVKSFGLRVKELLAARTENMDEESASPIEENLALFQEMFNLSPAEMEFTVFLFILSTHEIFEDFFVNRLGCNKFTGRKHLSAVLNLSVTELNEVLMGTLQKIDAFEMDSVDLRLQEDYLKLIWNPSAPQVLERLFSKVPEDTLPLEHHFNLEKEANFVLKLLEEKRETSTHILLYGAPGTGKTSFARGVAQKLGVPAYEIVQDQENSSGNRRGAIVACLNMTNSGPGSLIIVDEADNVLGTRFSWFMRGETQDKGWLNHLLEEPGVRMIWIVNDIEHIEASVRRRFAFSIRFTPLGRRSRVQLWENVLKRYGASNRVSSSEILDFASRYEAGAGAIDLAVRKAMETKPPSKKAFRETVSALLQAHGTLLNSGVKPQIKDKIEKNYSLEGLNVEGDLSSLVQQLERFDQHLRHSGQSGNVSMNLLFHGPPGSGKSELARFLADHLDREILCKRLSDLRSPYVGESERNLSAAFAEAETREALFILDEADSLLFSRERARHSWEISFTNEFLTQMERFRGILICTTNRLMDLDEASLRRFSYKVGFAPLKPEGNIIFYKRLLGPLSPGPLPESATQALLRMTDLCPGDFKAVRDRFAFYPRTELNHNMLVEALAGEGKLKKLHQGRKPVGF